MYLFGGCYLTPYRGGACPGMVSSKKASQPRAEQRERANIQGDGCRTLRGDKEKPSISDRRRDQEGNAETQGAYVVY